MGVHIKAKWQEFTWDYSIYPVTDTGRRLLGDTTSIALNLRRSRDKDGVVSEIVRQLNLLADLQANETRDRAVREANRVANKLG